LPKSGRYIPGSGKNATPGFNTVECSGVLFDSHDEASAFGPTGAGPGKALNQNFPPKKKNYKFLGFSLVQTHPVSRSGCFFRDSDVFCRSLVVV
jgi:hypothetical protein